MKIAVIGSTGMLGRAAAWAFIRAGHEVHGSGRNIPVGAYDCIINCAGVPRGTPGELFDGNVLLPREVAKMRGRVVHVSSENVHAIDGYGPESKRQGEEAFRHRPNTVIVRPGTILSGTSRPNHNSAFASWLHAIQHGLPVRYTAGSSRHYVALRDVVALIVQAAQAPAMTGVAELVGHLASVQSVALSLAGAAHSSSVCMGEDRSTPPARTDEAQRLDAVTPLDEAIRVALGDYRAMPHLVDVPATNDRRGALTEVPIRWSQRLYAFTVNPGQARGGHYHAEQREQFTAVTPVEVALKSPVGSTQFHLAPGRTFRVEPGVSHRFWCPGGQPSVVIANSTQPYVPNESPDTFPETP